MSEADKKSGRGRRYRLEAEARFGELARSVAMLDEHTARLMDLVSDVSDEAGNHVPEWGENSIWWLCWHMGWGEATWISQAGGGPALPALPPGTVFTRSGVLEPFGAIRDATKTYVERLARGEARFTAPGPFEAVDEMLDHLNWHWTYHSGQVGLMRRLVGHRYQWRFA